MLFLLLVVNLLGAVSSRSGPEPGAATYFPVKFVVDGDTLEIGGVGRVRLLGIDAPEAGRGFDTAAPFAAEARERLRSLVAMRYVRLEFDDESRDSYGRRLAYVFRDDRLFVNATLLREGLARVSARRPLRRLEELRRAEAEARGARRGMWGQLPVRTESTLRARAGKTPRHVREASAPPRRCEATTKLGRRCRRAAVESGRFCRQHDPAFRATRDRPGC